MAPKAAVAGGVGLTGVATIGAYTMGAFDGLGSTINKHSTNIQQTFRDIRKEDDLKCMDSFLPELYYTIKDSLDNSTPLKDAVEITSENQVESNFFTPTTYQFNNCLVLNWDKKLDTKNKGHGNFRYLWGFNHGDQALVMFNSLETSPTSSQIDISGGVYFVKKGGKSGTQWIVHKYKKWQTSSAPSINDKNLEDKFPKVGDGILEKNQFAEDKDYWGFISKKEDLNDICSSSNGCQDSKLTIHKKFRGKWEWSKDSGTHKPIDWVKSPDGFTNIYPEISNFKTLLSNKFANMKGKWVKKSLQLN